VRNKTCQAAGWNEKEHKANCKLLKDPDLRGLFVLKWAKFDGYIRFPLRTGTTIFGSATNKAEEAQGIPNSPGKEEVDP
jgi:hypothetical protein